MSENNQKPDLARGARLFRTRCGLCHTITPGCNKVGPSLWGIMGSKAASMDGFAYSRAMKESDITWTDESMVRFLKRPKDFVPGNKMVFRGFASDKDCVDVTEYMKAECQRKKLF